MPDDPAAPTGRSDPERTRSNALAAGAVPAGPALPSRIGRYTILRVLGEGGMGTVYEAQQDQPKRAVALKVIRAGYLSPQLLKRFEHESQVLGRLQHPGIAQVYEAGTVRDESGQPVPFFAMEFIRGAPLTEYAKHKNLGTRERLDLVARICDAVYHAHQKGVIHRDLKPNNILVDESGQPKILDFGVARATGSDVQQTTMQTDIGQLIGTVPYMSPEQVGGDPDDLDTRSDVYALGVVAYELLAGRLPYDLQRKLIHEAARIIKEEEPTRLSSINRTLKGDVETIVAKALEKNKARRYQSAESFASDIRRYLKDEPIAARPASTWYQLAKFSRRHRALVGGVVASFVILLGGLAGTAWQGKLARDQRDLAVEAQRAEKQRANELKIVSDFQSNMLEQVDPNEAGRLLEEDLVARLDAALAKAGITEADRGAQSIAFRASLRHINRRDAALALINRTILKPAVAAIESQFRGQPVVDAQLRQVLASLYTDLGLLDDAAPLQTKALEIRRRVLGEEHTDTLASINAMGYLQFGIGNLSESESYWRRALERRRRVLGDDDSNTLISIDNMGALMRAQGRLAEAEVYTGEALQRRRRVLGDEHPDTLTSLANMGGLLKDQGRLSEAEPYWSEALEKSRRVFGEEDPRALTSINNMGGILEAQGKLIEAEPYYLEALEKRRRVLGDEHPETLTSINNVGALLLGQGRLSDAEPYLKEALEKSRRVLGEEHPDTLNCMNNLGVLLYQQRKLSEAEPYSRRALAERRRVLGDDHPDTLSSMNNLGVLLQRQGRLSEAEPYYLEALERKRRVLGGEHLDTLTAIINMGDLLRAQGKADAAEPYMREAVAGHIRTLGAHRWETADAQMRLGMVLRDLAHFAEAEEQMLKAESVLRTAHEVASRHRECVGALVKLYNAWHSAEPAKGYDAKAAEWKAKLEARDKPAGQPAPSDK